jgi:ABC-type glycerol-3-phosphate transport system substrate-binding protein
MRRLISMFAVLAVSFVLAACGGDDEESATTSSTPSPTTPAPSESPSPSDTAPGAGQLPPALIECFEDKGIEADSVEDIHSAPPEVVQECFAALHGGGGAP